MHSNGLSDFPAGRTPQIALDHSSPCRERRRAHPP
jgi:hypothetical protein